MDDTSLHTAVRTLAMRNYRSIKIKGRCHGDFAVFWSELLKYLTKSLFSNKKLLLEYREGNIKGFLQERTSYNQF